MASVAECEALALAGQPIPWLPTFSPSRTAQPTAVAPRVTSRDGYAFPVFGLTSGGVCLGCGGFYCNHSRYGPAAAACPPLGGFCTSQAFSMSVVSPPPSPPPPWQDRTQYLVGASPVATSRPVALPPLRSSQYGRVAYTLSFAFKYAGACGGANASSSQAVLWRGCDGSGTAFRAPAILVGPNGRVSASHSACASRSSPGSSPGVALLTDQCVSHAVDIVVAHAALADGASSGPATSHRFWIAARRFPTVPAPAAWPWSATRAPGTTSRSPSMAAP